MHLVEDSAQQVLDAVLRGDADFGLGFMGSQEPALRFDALMRERYVLAMPRSHPWAAREAIGWPEPGGAATGVGVAAERQSPAAGPGRG